MLIGQANLTVTCEYHVTDCRYSLNSRQLICILIVMGMQEPLMLTNCLLHCHGRFCLCHGRFAFIEMYGQVSAHVGLSKLSTFHDERFTPTRTGPALTGSLTLHIRLLPVLSAASSKGGFISLATAHKQPLTHPSQVNSKFCPLQAFSYRQTANERAVSIHKKWS